LNGLLGQSANWPVQNLVSQQAECVHYVLPIRLAQPTIQLGEKLLHDRLLLRLEVFNQPLDYRAGLPADQVRENGMRLFHDDRSGVSYVIAPLRQRVFAHASQVVDVEKPSAVTVVDARVEIARHGDVKDYH
jgi:hypothetical protein